MNRSLVLVWPCCAFLAALPAQATVPPEDLIRSTHADLVKVRAEMQELQGNPRPRDNETAQEWRARIAETAERRKSPEFREKRDEISKRMEALQADFLKSFRQSDWKSFDATKDAVLLKEGLLVIARDAQAPKEAVPACRHFVSLFGDDPTATTIRAETLPMALLSLDDPGEAMKVLDEGIVAADTGGKAFMLVTLGDMFAASGDAAMATKKYEEAAPLATHGIVHMVNLRTTLIGKAAPEIDSKTWIGGEATPLSALKGKVVLIDFWATWSPPCRRAMPALNEMFKAHHKDGLEVMGVTRFYPHGYVAENPEQLLTGGRMVRGLTEATFEEHVSTFRANTGIEYPFVIGTAKNRDDYRNASPSDSWLVVVGPDGNIALVVVGPGKEGLVRFAVKSLLGKVKPDK